VTFLRVYHQSGQDIFCLTVTTKQKIMKIFKDIGMMLQLIYSAKQPNINDE